MPTDPTEATLLPCPFCGGEATVQSWSWPYPRWRVVCGKCKCQASGRRADPSDAILAWNTRSRPTSDSGERASVVAWLRAESTRIQELMTDEIGMTDMRIGVQLKVDNIADAIERGDHFAALSVNL